MPGSRYDVRPEQDGDRTAILSITEAAFGQPDEARLAEALLDKHGENAISIVTTSDETEIVGHVLLTPAWIDDENGSRLITGMALAPVSVHPEHQRRGVGAALCKMALRQASKRQIPFVILLGHPEYYPRFGFEPGHHRGIQCPYPDAPKDAFMITVLDPQRLKTITGMARFDPLFDQVS